MFVNAESSQSESVCRLPSIVFCNDFSVQEFLFVIVCQFVVADGRSSTLADPKELRMYTFLGRHLLGHLGARLGAPGANRASRRRYRAVSWSFGRPVGVQRLFQSANLEPVGVLSCQSMEVFVQFLHDCVLKSPF